MVRRTRDLRPEAIDRIHRERIERLRTAGRYRELVLWLIGHPEPWQDEGNGYRARIVYARPTIQPTREDLLAAYHESPDPCPQPILDYVMTHYVKGLPLKTGPKIQRSTADDDRVFEIYTRALVDAIDAHEADGTPETRDVKGRATKVTEEQSGAKSRTIASILAARRLIKSPPK